jgi:hypothetical protein
MSSKSNGAYASTGTGMSSHLMKMKFMQRGQDSEKRKQMQEEADLVKKEAEWGSSESTVYVSFAASPSFASSASCLHIFLV